MKIVASTKLTRAQRAMTESRAYGQNSATVFEQAETKPLDMEGKKSLLIICSSDKGLCGGIHSGMSRATRKLLQEDPNIDLAIIGEKCKSQMSRSNPKNMVLNFSGIGKDITTLVLLMLLQSPTRSFCCLLNMPLSRSCTTSSSTPAVSSLWLLRLSPKRLSRNHVSVFKHTRERQI
jgi:F0F1-type ATP synthase gamma subunit